MVDDKKDEYKLADEEHKEPEKEKVGVLEFLKSAWFSAESSFFGGRGDAASSDKMKSTRSSTNATSNNNKINSVTVITQLFKNDQARKSHVVFGNDKQLTNNAGENMEDKLSGTLTNEEEVAKDTVVKKPGAKSNR